MSFRRAFIPLALTAAAGFVAAGCASEPTVTVGPDSTPAAADAPIVVVASTNVYGQIVEEIGGNAVEVTALITSAAQDPHSYEPSAEDQLHVSKAELLVENGGGYDSFMEALAESSGSSAEVITAVEHSHDYPGNDGHAEESHDHEEDASAHEDDAAHEEEGHDHDEAEHAEEGHEHEGHDHIEGFNEHVWYDPHTIAHVADDIAEHLGELRPELASTFTANAEQFHAGIEALEHSLEELKAANGDTHSFQTEPLATYLAAAAGIENLAPEEFTEAVEEGHDVPAATLLEAVKLIEGGEISLVIVNAQTGGAETEQVRAEAEEHNLAVVEFTETLPDGQTYLSWMETNVQALADALGT